MNPFFFKINLLPIQAAVVAELETRYRNKEKGPKEVSDGAIENIISGKLYNVISEKIWFSCICYLYMLNICYAFIYVLNKYIIY